MTEKEIEVANLLMDLDGGEFYIPTIKWAKAIIAKYPQIEAEKVAEAHNDYIGIHVKGEDDFWYEIDKFDGKRIQVFVKEVWNEAATNF